MGYFDQPEPRDMVLGMTCDDDDERGCDFSADVDVSVLHGVGEWTCPDCGHVHEDVDVTPWLEPDPDEANDRRFDR